VRVDPAQALKGGLLKGGSHASNEPMPSPDAAHSMLTFGTSRWPRAGRRRDNILRHQDQPAGAVNATVGRYRPTSVRAENGNVGGSFGSGRREIKNWDGVPEALAAPKRLPG